MKTVYRTLAENQNGSVAWPTIPQWVNDMGLEWFYEMLFRVRESLR